MNKNYFFDQEEQTESLQQIKILGQEYTNKIFIFLHINMIESYCITV